MAAIAVSTSLSSVRTEAPSCRQRVTAPCWSDRPARWSGLNRPQRQRSATMIDLKGRVSLVTGASRGIGRACALRLAEAGSDVVINYLTSEAAAQEVAAQIITMGRRAAIIKADV